VAPTPSSIQEREDYFGNKVTDVVIRNRHDELTLTARANISVNANEDILLDLSPPSSEVRERMRVPNKEEWDAARFCFPSPRISVAGAHDYAAECITAEIPFLRGVMDLTQRIFQEFEYQGGVTDVYTPVPEVLEARAGVCQDFAHVAIACVRSLGLPARYVSGYLLTQPPDGQLRLTGADASHAWFSVWCPEFGWVDFDPTNNIRAHNEHIMLSWGRDYSDVSPSRGFIHGGGEQTLSVAVDVLRV